MDAPDFLLDFRVAGFFFGGAPAAADCVLRGGILRCLVDVELCGRRQGDLAQWEDEKGHTVSVECPSTLV
jgi:hypothetical protein